MKGILIMIFLGMLSIAHAQNRKLIVEPVVGNIHVRLDETLNWGEQGTLTISEFKCYFSKIHLEAATGKQLSVADSVVLIDLSSDTLPAFSIPNLDGPAKLSLLVGLDSIASTSGAMGGKLDPMYGMYWSWQSGYINLKLSGTWVKDGRTQAFTFHLGGCQKPFENARSLELTIQPEAAHMQIDFQPLLQEMLLERGKVDIMSPGFPGNEAMELFIQGIRVK